MSFELLAQWFASSDLTAAQVVNYQGSSTADQDVIVRQQPWRTLRRGNLVPPSCHTLDVACSSTFIKGHMRSVVGSAAPTIRCSVSHGVAAFIEDIKRAGKRIDPVRSVNVKVRVKFKTVSDPILKAIMLGNIDAFALRLWHSSAADVSLGLKSAFKCDAALSPSLKT